ncbi:Gfo/Idh/MocA family oxidoreductase [Blastococcus capsensis]|nr:Gfo/Idh/MocA family oxidoreductase [Blastococcus capsensis]MDK3257012.1 Gfo/Idh/MocA family oxidoreductase [Blastococcus capsensis]
MRAGPRGESHASDTRWAAPSITSRRLLPPACRRTSGAATAGDAAAAARSALPAGYRRAVRGDDTDTVRCGVVGYGRMGSLHAATIAASPDADLVAVCDPDEHATRRASREWSVRTTPILEELLCLPLDAVVVTSPTPQHADHIRAAARAGKAIFAEKPVGLTWEESDCVLREVVDAAVPFQINFQRRWDQRFRAVKKSIKAGDIGQPVLFKFHGRDPDASRASHWGLHRNGGLFLNCAIHDYDAVRYLTGAEVTSLNATGAAVVHKGLAEVGDIDTCSTTLFLDDGSMAITEWSRYATYGFDVGLEVVGTDGFIYLSRGDPSGVVVTGGDAAAPSVYDVFGDAYRASVLGFIDAVRNGHPATPGVDDARAALQVALCARRSYQSGGGVLAVAPPAPRHSSA